MADGNSTGPAVTPPVDTVATVVAEGEFPSKLNDEQIMLQLMNNHVIQRAVLNYNDAAEPWYRIINEITEEARRDIARDQDFVESTDPDTVRAVMGANRAQDEREDVQNVRALNNARSEIDALEPLMEDAISAELQKVSDEFFDLAQILNGRNPDGERIRAEITEIDAQVAQLEQTIPVVEDLLENPGDLGPQPNWNFNLDASRRDDLAAYLESYNVPPPPRGQGRFENWQDTFRDPNHYSYHPRQAVISALGDMKNEVRRLGQSYPTEYMRYQRLLGGFSLERESVDWWHIFRSAAWIIGEELLWTAATIAVGAATGGIGAVLMVSARTINRASVVGRTVRQFTNGARNIAKWFRDLTLPVRQKAVAAFDKAWGKVRFKQGARESRTGVSARGQGAQQTARRCVNGRCV